MTADLADLGGELARAERVAARGRLDPARRPARCCGWTTTRPDFVDEAAGRSAPSAGAARRCTGSRRGCAPPTRAPPAHQTVVGHSYGSLVVGTAAARPRPRPPTDVVFVGTPGVGVGPADELHVPPGQVWASTSRTDVIQYAPVAPDEPARGPGAGPARAGGRSAARLRPARGRAVARRTRQPGVGAGPFGSAGSVRPDAGLDAGHTRLPGTAGDRRGAVRRDSARGHRGSADGAAPVTRR